MKGSKTLWIYGDSWAWGWAGGDPTPKQFQNRYTLLFGEYLGISNIKDSAEFGWSLGQIVERFLKESIRFKKGDILFLTIPPDSRWYYTPMDDQVVHTLFQSDSNYEKLLEINNYNLYHFSYHLNLFITLISDVCSKLGVQCMMQHNYGKLELFDWCRKDDILDIDNSMWDWLELPSNYDLSTFKESDGPQISSNTDFKMFEKYLIKLPQGYDLHPNELGHQVIFKNIINLYEQKYKSIV